jgi:hypothetical protein
MSADRFWLHVFFCLILLYLVLENIAYRIYDLGGAVLFVLLAYVDIAVLFLAVGSFVPILSPSKDRQFLKMYQKIFRVK